LKWLGCEIDFTAPSSTEIKSREAIFYSLSYLYGGVLNYLSTEGNLALTMRTMGAIFTGLMGFARDLTYPEIKC
jgi:hypothetical protein